MDSKSIPSAVQYIQSIQDYSIAQELGSTFNAVVVSLLYLHTHEPRSHENTRPMYVSLCYAGSPSFDSRQRTKQNNAHFEVQ